MALKELAAVLREGKADALSTDRAEGHLDKLDEVGVLRRGLAAVAEVVEEVRASWKREASDLELQIKDLRSDLGEILTLKVKPRLASLEREASDVRRRLLPLPTCAVAGEHMGSCRRRVTSPESWCKAKKDLQDTSEALLDRARREMLRQEEVAQDCAAASSSARAALDLAGKELLAEAQGTLRAAKQAEQRVQEAANQTRQQADHNVADFRKAETMLQAELREVSESTREAETTLQAELREMSNSAREATGALQRQLRQVEAQLGQQEAVQAVQAEQVARLAANSQEATSAVRDSFSKVQSLSTEALTGIRTQMKETRQRVAEAEKALRAEVARSSEEIAGKAESEAQQASQMVSRLAAGVRGVEEMVERRTQGMATELEASVTAVSSLGAAFSRSARAMSSEVAAEKDRAARVEEDIVARLRRFEEAVKRQSQSQAQVLDELHEAVAAASERRRGEEQALLKKVQDVLRSTKDQAPKERRETIEAAGRAVAEARQELQQELKTSSEALRRRAEKAREEVHREISMLRKDIEEQVRDELRKEMVSLGQECSVSIEAQVKQSLASNRLERCVEELLLEHLARERSEARQAAAQTQRLCEEHSQAAASKLEEQMRQLLWQVEDQTRVAAGKTQEGWLLAQTLQEKAASAMQYVEGEALRFGRWEQTVEESSCGAARLEAEAQRLVISGEEQAVALARTTEEQAMQVVQSAEEQATSLARRVEDAVRRCDHAELQTARSVQEISGSTSLEMEGLKAAVQRSVRKLEEELEQSSIAAKRQCSAMEAEASAAARVAACKAEDGVGAAELRLDRLASEAAVREEHAEATAQQCFVTEAALREVRGELQTFMEEQRVFCSFLDTEQRSYQELMRQEVNALCRLVDAAIRIGPDLQISTSLEGLDSFQPVASPKSGD